MAKKEVKTRRMKSIDQLTITQEISKSTGLLLKDVEEVIKLEQQLNIKYLKKGYKVMKNDYLIFEPKVVNQKEWVSPLDGKTHLIAKHVAVSIRLGKAFKEQLVLKGND